MGIRHLPYTLLLLIRTYGGMVLVFRFPQILPHVLTVYLVTGFPRISKGFCIIESLPFINNPTGIRNVFQYCWKRAGHEYDEIRDNKPGWDITDFGLGRLEDVGFSLFTIRNGNPKI